MGWNTGLDKTRLKWIDAEDQRELRRDDRKGKMSKGALIKKTKRLEEDINELYKRIRHHRSKMHQIMRTLWEMRESEGEWKDAILSSRMAYDAIANEYCKHFNIDRSDFDKEVGEAGNSVDFFRMHGEIYPDGEPDGSGSR